MGLLSDLKRLFFAQKSVAKSAGKKAADRTKEFADDVKDEASEVIAKVKDSGSEMLETVKEKTTDAVDNIDLDAAIEKAKKFTDKLKGTVTGDENPDVTDETIDSREQQMRTESPGKAEDVNPSGRHNKSPEWLEKAGDKASELGDAAGEKFKDLSEKIGKKAMDLSDELSEKTRKLADKLDEKLDEIDAKARKMAEDDAKNETPRDHAPTRHDENPHLTGSTLEHTDSFFDKAKRFADGESITPDIMKPTDNDGKASSSTKKAYGFDDLDGDGNEIIDDAIIDKEEE